MAEQNAGGYVCHYDVANQGPQTRLDLLNGLGADGENVGGYSDTIQNYNGAPQTEPSTTQIWQSAEAGWVGEKSSNGLHWTTLSNANGAWAGMAVATTSGVTSSTYFFQGVAELDLTSPGITTQQGIYPATGCPAGITANNS